MKNTQHTKEHHVCDEHTNDVHEEASEVAKKQDSMSELQENLEKKTKEVDEYVGLLQRTYAEFDNYKKRTAKEKDAIYSNAVADVISNILPVLDNLEKAMELAGKGEPGNIAEGLEMVLRQFKDAMKNLKVTEIETKGQKFNPELHEAVMHIQDENFSEGEVIEVFRKGYMYGDKVIRHSMVKVAN